MRSEVHVHGTIQLRSGVSQAQIEAALQPWLDYLDVEGLDEAKSIHRDEPGIVFDPRRRLLELCWSGDVGRNFRKVVEDCMQSLGRFSDHAAEIALSYYHEDGHDELAIVFVGPTTEAVFEAQRRRMIEDISNLLSRHFGQQEISEVVSHVNELFSRSATQAGSTGQSELASEPVPVMRGRKHLH
jgi:hypothetical protein